MSMIKPGNKICILLNVGSDKRLLKGDHPNKPVYANTFTSGNIVGEIEKIENGNCVIGLGKYDRSTGFVPGQEKLDYTLEALRGLEKAKCIKLLV